MNLFFQIFKFFEPDKHFLFFTNEKQIKSKISRSNLLKKKNNNKRTQIQYNERTNHIRSKPNLEEKKTNE